MKDCYKAIFVLLALTSCMDSLLGQNPNWEAPDAYDYDFNSTLVATITLNDTLSYDMDDELALFAGNELRGLSVPINVGNGVIVHFVTIYSDVAEEDMIVKVYHGNTEDVYTVADTFEFTVQTIYGTVDSPMNFDVFSGDDAPISIDSIPDQIMLEGYPFDTINLDFYLNQPDEEAVVWSIEENHDLNATIMNSLLIVTGPSGVSGTSSITVKAEEQQSNGAPQSAQREIQFDIVPIHPSPAWDSFPNQSILKGGVFDTVELHQYENEYTGAEILYDYLPVIEESENPVGFPNWNMEEGFPTTMSITIQVDYTDRYQFSGATDSLGAFINGELRGVATSDSMGLYFLTIGGEPEEVDQIELAFYSGEMKKIFAVNNDLTYEPHGIIGSVEEPVVFDIAPILPIVTIDPVVGGILNAPILIQDTSFIGIEYFDFIAADPLYPAYLNDTTRVSFCISQDSASWMVFYADNDGDGLGSSQDSIYSCVQPIGYVANKSDCNDNNTQVSVVDLVVVETSGSATNDGVICNGATATISVSNGALYEWEDGSIDSFYTDIPMDNSEYRVTVTFDSGCMDVGSTEVSVEGNIVYQEGNDGLHSLRSVLSCAVDNDTIYFDQPTINQSVLLDSIDLVADVTILGLSNIDRPEIVFDFTSTNNLIHINNQKWLRLKDVDFKIEDGDTSVNIGPGTLIISGTTNVRSDE